MFNNRLNVHTPVLLNEVLEIFDPQPGERYIDATVNGGGHALAILERVGSAGSVLGIDWDPILIERLAELREPPGNLTLVCDSYVHLGEIAREKGFGQVQGVLFDLGFSSFHIDASGRGFSFGKDETLDMRYHPEGVQTAAGIVNTESETELARLFQEYGEERFARRIAREIVLARRKHRLATTGELVEVVARAVPAWYRKRSIHCATKIFQALRIAVNTELANISQGLAAASEILAPEGMIAVITFHSIEDRIVKLFFREEEKQGRMRLLMKRPRFSSVIEKKNNPRARSAKLRAASRVR